MILSITSDSIGSIRERRRAPRWRGSTPSTTPARSEPVPGDSWGHRRERFRPRRDDPGSTVSHRWRSSCVIPRLRRAQARGRLWSDVPRDRHRSHVTGRSHPARPHRVGCAFSLVSLSEKHRYRLRRRRPAPRSERPPSNSAPATPSGRTSAGHVPVTRDTTPGFAPAPNMRTGRSRTRTSTVRSASTSARVGTHDAAPVPFARSNRSPSRTVGTSSSSRSPVDLTGISTPAV